MGSNSYWNNKEYYTTQQKILEGRSIARETARVLNLASDASFMRYRSTAKAARPPDLEDATSILMSRVSVEPIRESRLVNVHIVDSDPMRARRILSTLVSIYLERNVDLVVNSTGAASEWLRDQVDKLKGELEHSELALHEYKKDKHILSVTLDDQSNMLRGEMQQLNEALTRTSTKRQEVQARSRELDKVDSTDPTVLPATELLSNVLLNNLRADYIKAKAELSALLGEGKGDMHPLVESARARVETTREALLAEVRNIQGAVRRDLEEVTRESAGIAGLFEHAKQRAMDLNMLEIEYRRLERSKTNTEKLYSLVLERSKESDLTSMLRFNNLSVVEQPVVPKTPFRPRVPINLAVGLVLGVVLGFVAITLRERLDQTVRAPQDVESDIGIPLLGLLPMVTAQSQAPAYYSRRRRASVRREQNRESPTELLVHEAPSSNIAECARSIRTSLMFASPDKPFRRILITSGSPGEGKTTIACTMAIAFAQTGSRILLIDCDLRRARLHRVFRKENIVGVTTALQNPSDAMSAVSETVVPNLSLLTSGPHVPNPAELVQSDSFNRLLDVLSTQFDRIIIDSPPILAVTDSSIIAARVDATVLVARSGKTKRDAIRRVVRKLSDIKAAPLGLVLNALMAPRTIGAYYYPYAYYGYSYKNTYDSTGAPNA
jgi:capsular exopolysaccharide synthesis family protein